MSQKNILIIDDDPSSANLLKISLEENNYIVSIAYDGEEAFIKAKDKLPDLIVMDLMLPNIDGFMLCALFKRNKRYTEIPIILFSIRDHEQDRELGKRVGADAYVVKTMEFKPLLEKIEDLLDRLCR